jgi:RNA polymerase-binding protein DksA
MTRRETLDPRSLNAIERMLMAKRAALQESLRRAVTLGATAGAGRLADTATWASESLQGEMEAALLDQRNREVAQIDAALQRLARREYGLCQDCEERIGLERLRALPFARRCTPCQARTERRERRFAATPPTAVALGDDDAA